MGITIEKTFVVDAPSDSVWAFLIDPHSVARCLPGAAITEQLDERTFSGKMTIKVGPVVSSYKGKITFERLDPATHTAEISGRGQDVRGRGGADMRMTSRLTRGDGGTEVYVVSEVNVTGILAQFGRGMIEEVSDQLFQTFTERMRAALSVDGEAPTSATNGTEPIRQQAPADPSASDDALDVVSLGAKVGGRVVSRAVRHPIFWVFMAMLVIALYFIAR